MPNSMSEKIGQTGKISYEESVQAFLIKFDYVPSTQPKRVVSDFRHATLIALAREDEAMELRRGGSARIFLYSQVADTPLPVARAGSAVYFEALVGYCAANGLDPKQTLVENGIKTEDAQMYLEYAQFAHLKITEALQAQQGHSA